MRPTSTSTPEPALVPAGPTALVRETVRLNDAIKAVPRMSWETRPYMPPDAGQLALARAGFAMLADNHPEMAALLLGAVGFDVAELYDPRGVYYLVRESPDHVGHGWGVYALNPRTTRPYVLQAPHPKNDLHTDTQAIDLMNYLDARAVLISTSFRCATTERTRCTGLTMACGRKRRLTRFRVSDMSHTDRSIFHMAHEALLASGSEVVAVQLHGFARRPGRRMHVILSDGTRYRGGDNSLSNRLLKLLRQSVPKPRRAVVSCNDWREPGYVPLCGLHNVQGRQANGSRDACRKRPRRSTNRFLHIEQSLDARTQGGVIDPKHLASALATLIPCDGADGVPPKK